MIRQNISIVRARTHKLVVRLTNKFGKPYVMSSDENLIFGVKKSITDNEYCLTKTINYDSGFEQVAQSEQVPQWKENTYYSKETVSEIVNYILMTSEPEDWDTNYSDYYINNGVYPVELKPIDTESMIPNTYYYDIGMQNGNDYYSVIDTSKMCLLANVTKKEN